MEMTATFPDGTTRWLLLGSAVVAVAALILLRARLRSELPGLRHIAGGEWCTVSAPGRFFSHRRDQRGGRIATLAAYRHLGVMPPQSGDHLFPDAN